MSSRYLHHQGRLYWVTQVRGKDHSAECCSWWEAGPTLSATAGEEWEVGFFPLSMPPHGRWGAGPDPDIFYSCSLGGSCVPHQQGQLNYAVQVRRRACAQSWWCWAHSCCLVPAQNREPWAGGGVSLLLLLSLNVMNIFIRLENCICQWFGGKFI